MKSKNDKAKVVCAVCGKPIGTQKIIYNGRSNEPICSERCQKDAWGDVD